MEFKNKEGKWFSYMKGVPVTSVNDLDSTEFSFQGIDLADAITTVNGNGNGNGGGESLFNITFSDVGDVDPPCGGSGGGGCNC